MTDRPIADYALLSDRHSAALVSGDGSVDWLCLPRFDAPALFARLLDPMGGHWMLGPAGECDIRRRYLAGTLVLETRFRTPTGTAVLTDALALDEGGRGHDIGNASPHVLLRVLVVTGGEVLVAGEFAPRPEYGLVHPGLWAVEGGTLAHGGAQVIVLAGPPPTSIAGATARWDVLLQAGESLAFAAQHAVASEPIPPAWSRTEIMRSVTHTTAAWQSWSALHESGPKEVTDSGTVLQALTYHPTGAMIAAPTTSLPESIGGNHNYDYRFAWLRDAPDTLRALATAACGAEVERYRGWLLQAAGTNLQATTGLQVVYAVGGEHDLSERELPHLKGWRGSRPVRVGNAVWQQPPISVLGAVADSVWAHRQPDGHADPVSEALLRRMADMAAVRWPEADAGSWEMRGEPQQYLSSKLSCWLALDRALRFEEMQGPGGTRTEAWAMARDALVQTIVNDGWSTTLQSFTQVLGVDALDASGLQLALTGFLPATDPRIRATIEATAAGLRAPCGLLYRHLPVPGEQVESTFVVCTFWLVECLALIGEMERAEEAFERATAYANDVGLLSEQADPATGELVGNFPHARSHIGLINAARSLGRMPDPRESPSSA